MEIEAEVVGMERVLVFSDSFAEGVLRERRTDGDGGRVEAVIIGEVETITSFASSSELPKSTSSFINKSFSSIKISSTTGGGGTEITGRVGIEGIPGAKKSKSYAGVEVVGRFGNLAICENRG